MAPLVPAQGATGSRWVYISAATAVALTAVLPAFLVGAASVFLRPALDMDQADIGLAIGAFFAGAAVMLVVGGRVTDRLRPRQALVGVALANVFVLLGIGVFVQGRSSLVVAMLLAGGINGFGQPATNIALARGPRSNTAIIFGIKQSAVPGATMIAGLVVPVLGVFAGWRWIFIGSAVPVLAVAYLATRIEPTPTRGRAEQGVEDAGDVARAPLVALAVAAGIGSGAATSLGSFLVDSAVDVGFGVGAAGLLLSGCSVAGIATRLVVGWLSDSGRGRALLIVPAMLCLGAVGFALLGLFSGAGFVVGAVLAYAAGWGWAGLLTYAVVQLSPGTPGTATGIVMSGMAVGATLGPFAFGILVTHGSYSFAWGLASAAAMLSAGLLLLSRVWLIVDRDRRRSALVADTG